MQIADSIVAAYQATANYDAARIAQLQAMRVTNAETGQPVTATTDNVMPTERVLLLKGPGRFQIEVKAETRTRYTLVAAEISAR